MNKQEQEELRRQQLIEQIEQMQEQQVDHGSPTMFVPEKDENLVKYQLDVKEELVRIEHLLRGHIPKIDEEGNIYYDQPEDSIRILNEKGVNEILNILAWYLNKNIILSNFDETEVALRCKQFMSFLADFIANNYQRFGMDNKDKIKHYPMLVLNITNTIEAAYHRAIGGEERKSLSTARHITQTQPINSYGMSMGIDPQKNKFSVFNPSTWLR